MESLAKSSSQCPFVQKGFNLYENILRSDIVDVKFDRPWSPEVERRHSGGKGEFLIRYQLKNMITGGKVRAITVESFLYVGVNIHRGEKWGQLSGIEFVF